MKYSLIVAVYNRIDEVKELLDSAENLEFDPAHFEILFVDDGSNDGFEEFISTYESKSGLNTRAIFQENKGPGAARNHGMQKAKGEYFIFVDSDCTFPSHWLKEIDNVVQKEKFEAFGGPDTFRSDFSPLLKAINYSMTSKVGTGGTRGSKKMVGKFYPRSFNMGIHRKVYEDIGGMNKLRHGQDMDFSARIYEAGYKVGLISDAYVYHKRRTSLSKFFRQIFNWGVARINLSILHPQLLKLIHLLPSMILLGYAFSLVIGMIFPSLRWLLWLIIIGHVAVCLYAFLESLVKYKSIKTAILSILTLNIQVFAYGAGLLSALWQTRVLKKEEAFGFVKNYYGQKK